MKPLDLILKYSHERVDEEQNLNFLSFSLKEFILQHRRFDAALTAIARLHHVQKQHRNGGGILIYGPSGVGKSTVLEQYANHFPIYKDGDKTIIPVLKVICPSSASANGLVSAMYDAIGYPIPSRSDLSDKTIKICKLIKMFGVELLLIDEFQHAYYSRSMADFRQLIDTVKNIISITKVGSVLVGLNESEQVIASNEQVARRHSEKVEISNFKLNDEEDFIEFRAVLKSYQAELPLKPEVPLYEANLARRFLIGSDGNLDYLGRLLEKSIQVAVFAGLEVLTQSIYAAAFRDYVWKTVPDKLNPFHEESPLRRLDKVGEPFYPWHLKHAIGSPLARRNLINSTGAR